MGLQLVLEEEPLVEDLEEKTKGRIGIAHLHEVAGEVLVEDREEQVETGQQ